MNASPILKQGIEAIERLEEEKAEIAEQIKERKNALAAEGFDRKVVNAVLKRRKMTPEQRQEFDALLNIYEGAMGDLGDTPLGEAARRRLDRAPKSDADNASDAPDDQAPAPITEESIAEARAAGRAAVAEGKRVTENPYVAGDPRRAAWDEGWCMEAGSDGMDIPDGFKATPKKKAEPEDDPSDPETPDPSEGGEA